MIQSEALRRALGEVGDVSAQELAAFMQKNYGVTVRPQFIPILKATLKDKDLASVTTHCADGRIGALVVVPNGDNGAEVGIRVVSGLNGKSADACVSDSFRGGCIVARRALNFVPHASLRVPVVMRDACIDVPCDAPGFRIVRKE